MDKKLTIDGREISQDAPAYIIAEMSANHLMDKGRAMRIVEAAAEAGADAIKLQTYTADTITIDCDNEYFQIKQGTIWDGATLHKLYQEAYTPWEWQADLMAHAKECGIACFSSPFDPTAVDFLESIGCPAYKVASFEITDIPLIKKIACLGKPIIMSTGISEMVDIERAVNACKEEGNTQVALLKCTSSYPAPYEEINLRTIPNMADAFNVVAGLSDHTMGHDVAVASIALGAKIIEKHLTLARADGGPDAEFSMEPQEFKEMVDGIRNVEKALGRVTYDLTAKGRKNREFSRSLFIVEDIPAGGIITEKNVKSIRPGFGIHPMYLNEVLGRTVSAGAAKGTPLSWELLG